MQWRFEPGSFDVMVGGSSADADLLVKRVVLDYHFPIALATSKTFTYDIA